MDASTAAVVGAALGLLVGALGAWALLQRRGSAKGAAAAKEAAPGPVGPRPVPLSLPDGATTVLEQVGVEAVVVGTSDEAVVWCTPGAEGLGVVRGARVTDSALVDAIRAVARDHSSRDLELAAGGPRRLRRSPVLGARLAPLAPGMVFIVLEDRTQARRVDDVRRDFVANVSHELKTPVGALSLLAEAVAEAAEDPEAVRRFAGRMQHEGSRLNQLVNELIELSRLQGDNPLTHASVVDVDEVVADALDQVRTSASARRIDLRVTGSRRLAVYGDRGQLTAALRNLLDNAVSYSPERTHVAVGVHGIGDTVEVSVSDQGIGIPEAELERIFERFYRVDPARSRATGGTGLGLSIVKHIVQNHGGEIAVWSVEGSGSTFTLRLPAHLPPADEDGAGAVPSAAAGVPADPAPALPEVAL